MNDVIKVSGYRLGAAEIELALSQRSSGSYTSEDASRSPGRGIGQSLEDHQHAQSYRRWQQMVLTGGDDCTIRSDEETLEFAESACRVFLLSLLLR